MNNKVRDVLVKWFKDRGRVIESSLGYGGSHRIMIAGEYYEARSAVIEVVVYINHDVYIWGLGSPNALSKNIDPHKVMHLTMDDPEFFAKLGLLFPAYRMPICDIIGGIIGGITIISLMIICVIIILSPVMRMLSLI